MPMNMTMMKLVPNIHRSYLLGLTFLCLFGQALQAAPVTAPAEAGLPASLLRGGWTWDAQSTSFPPVEMKFTSDGKGGTPRFTYEWTVTGPRVATLKTQGKNGRQM